MCILLLQQQQKLLLLLQNYAPERDSVQVSDLWCEAKESWDKALGMDVANATYQCGEMSLQVCFVQGWVGGSCEYKHHWCCEYIDRSTVRFMRPEDALCRPVQLHVPPTRPARCAATSEWHAPAAPSTLPLPPPPPKHTQVCRASDSQWPTWTFVLVSIAALALLRFGIQTTSPKPWRAHMCSTLAPSTRSTPLTPSTPPSTRSAPLRTHIPPPPPPPPPPLPPIQVCRASTQWPTWKLVLISIVALVLLCTMIMLTSLFVSLCLARTGKVRRQWEWWRKHLSGMPQAGKMSIVVTDIEGYSGASQGTACVIIIGVGCVWEEKGTAWGGWVAFGGKVGVVARAPERHATGRQDEHGCWTLRATQVRLCCGCPRVMWVGGLCIGCVTSRVHRHLGVWWGRGDL
jgi:hypothetical protein